MSIKIKYVDKETGQYVPVYTTDESWRNFILIPLS